jgi:acetylornithine deacetylase/succinyl-diaminopimelate desuccinylase-like protein
VGGGAGGAGEAEIARYIAEWLEKAELEVELVETAPGRANVVGIARGTGGRQPGAACAFLNSDLRRRCKMQTQ